MYHSMFMLILTFMAAIAFIGCRNKTNKIEKELEQCPQKQDEILTEISIQDTSIATRLDDSNEKCRKEGYLPLTREENSNCTSKGLKIDDGLSHSVHIGKQIGAGAFGSTYLTTEEKSDDFVIKLSHEMRSGIESLCQEKAAYRILNGMHGTIPILHKTNGLSSNCEKRVLVMSRLGDADWNQVANKIDGTLFRRMAKLLEIIRNLHDMGILHYDIKGDNVRVDSNDPESVFLIDFGNSISYVDENGKVNSQLSARDDLDMLISMWAKSVANKSWFIKLNREIRCLGKTDRFNYEKWISCLNAISRKNLRDECT